RVDPIGPPLHAGLRIYRLNAAVHIVGGETRPREETGEASALLELWRGITVDVSRRRVLPCGHVEETGARTVRGAVPIRAALIAWIDECAFLGRCDPGYWIRPALFVEAIDPVHLDERKALQELTTRAVENVGHA